MNKNAIKGTVRDSNFELFRIILMLAIVIHHYVVNSGIVSVFDFNNITPNMIFLQFVGVFGKTGINCFVLITGYFMSKTEFRFTRFLKLYLEVKFYGFVIYTIFIISGYEAFEKKSFIKMVFSSLYGVNTEFVGTFLAVYFLVPFINCGLRKCKKEQHLFLIAVLVFIYTMISTFWMSYTYNYMGWMITAYIIGAYVRTYPSKLLDKKRVWGFLSIVSVLLMWGSILAVDFITSEFGFKQYYFMMVPENKLFALICSFSAFIWFKNLKMKPSKFINTIAASTFGVLLIHANSVAMRRFLWIDLLKNTEYYNSNLLFAHAICSCIGVYVICVIIDHLRIRFIERPLFGLIEAKKVQHSEKYERIKEKIYRYIPG